VRFCRRPYGRHPGNNMDKPDFVDISPRGSADRNCVGQLVGGHGVSYLNLIWPFALPGRICTKGQLSFQILSISVADI
jgi:hypothetical protein